MAKTETKMVTEHPQFLFHTVIYYQQLPQRLFPRVGHQSPHIYLNTCPKTISYFPLSDAWMGQKKKRALVSPAVLSLQAEALEYSS